LDPIPTLGGGRQTGIKSLVRFAGSSSAFRSLVALARETNSAVVVRSNAARSVDRLGQRLLKALSEDAG
jgi:hypothetical protein